MGVTMQSTVCRAAAVAFSTAAEAFSMAASASGTTVTPSSPRKRCSSWPIFSWSSSAGTPIVRTGPPSLRDAGLAVELAAEPVDVGAVLLILPPFAEHLLAPVPDGGVVDVALGELPEDAAPRIELFHRLDGAQLQLVGAHAPRLVHAVVAVVEGPVLVDDVLVALGVQRVPVG